MGHTTRRLRFFSIVWVLLFPSHSTSTDPKHEPKNIFILAGQSNMAGRGGIIDSYASRSQIWDGIVPPACRPNPSILRLNAKLAWEEAHEPLHAGIDVYNINGVGPGLAFANAVLAKNTDFGVIGLVPCAIGGTNISQWEKGGLLYERMVKRARASVEDGNGIIQALLWYQGESDTVVRKDAETYKQRLEKLFDDIRLDLMSPMLPIIQVALASGEGRFIDKVREAQFGTELLNVRTVDPLGLAVRSDKLHLTTESQVRLGRMMANAFIQFLPNHLSSTTTSTQTSSSSPTKSSNLNLIHIAFIPFFNILLLILTVLSHFV
ncbi:hypothetical protein UlMin_035303 [Ulmus minor]